jgi:hypothetical protein
MKVFRSLTRESWPKNGRDCLMCHIRSTAKGGGRGAGGLDREEGTGKERVPSETHIRPWRIPEMYDECVLLGVATGFIL